MICQKFCVLLFRAWTNVLCRLILTVTDLTHLVVCHKDESEKKVLLGNCLEMGRHFQKNDLASDRTNRVSFIVHHGLTSTNRINCGKALPPALIALFFPPDEEKVYFQSHAYKYFVLAWVAAHTWSHTSSPLMRRATMGCPCQILIRDSVVSSEITTHAQNTRGEQTNTR